MLPDWFKTGASVAREATVIPVLRCHFVTAHTSIYRRDRFRVRASLHTALRILFETPIVGCLAAPAADLYGCSATRERATEGN